MRPAWAIATTSVNISCSASAGVTSICMRASLGPALANEWATPGGTSITSPGSATTVRQAEPEAHACPR